MLMVVEKLPPDTYHELIDIWEQSVRATHHFLPEDYIVQLKPLILENYFDAVDLFGVRDVEGSIQGFLGLSADKIEMLFIDSGIRGKGIGKALMHFAVVEKHIRKVDVNEQNEHTVAFYKKLAFAVTNRLTTDSLGKPYPILEMELVNDLWK